MAKISKNYSLFQNIKNGHKKIKNIEIFFRFFFTVFLHFLMVLINIYNFLVLYTYSITKNYQIKNIKNI